jgi:hypothetical protein
MGYRLLFVASMWAADEVHSEGYDVRLPETVCRGVKENIDQVVNESVHPASSLVGGM